MEEDEEYYSDNSYAYLTLCGEPTLYEGLKFAKDLVLANVVLRFIIQYTTLPHIVRHSLSLVLGSFLLYNNVGMSFLWNAVLTIGSYATMFILTLFMERRRGLVLSIVVILFLLSSELFVMDPKMWQQIRGIQMIASMKIISLAVDLERGVFKRVPNPAEFAGYVVCPANCILGPWMSFHKYNQALEKKFISIVQWIKYLIVYLFISLMCLFLSNCFVPWYITDDTHKWLVAYRDAQSFRTSHYFVSFMSQMSMIAAGFSSVPDGYSDLQITKPYYIELPRSLVQVVVYWNIPMHQWLKNYVFKVCQPYGQFLAIFITYAISSMLHGLNFQLSAVLLSIGTFSYVEYKIRSKVASIFSICCLVNPCPKNCPHTLKGNTIYARSTNILFSCLAIMHLAYLGVMFEASFSMQEVGYSFSHTLLKWASLNYASHIVVAFTYFTYVLI